MVTIKLKFMRKQFTLFLVLFALTGWAQETDFRFLDSGLPVNERVDILVSQMTVSEKINQMLFTAPAIERLKIPAYNWWNECLHGVARAGYATVFPQSITIAGTWDTSLVYRVAGAISDEARAKHHEFVRRGKRGIYQGLTFWSPNINIFRDPRWGRGHETYGEDPYLTGQLGKEFVKGIQGNDPKYLKAVATAKHFAVHSGPEPLRHKFNALISERDLRETYLPAFKTLVKDGGVYSVMGAYNQFRNKPCCANPFLEEQVLRNEWGFKGYIVSDCWAISDFFEYQGFSKDAAEASAAAVKAGTDLECGVAFRKLKDAYINGLITEKEIDVSVKRLMTARMKLGMFDDDSKVAYAQIPFSANTSEANAKLALEAARKSIILLKNDNNLLPLPKSVKKIAVIGPNADNWEALIGNYNGIPKYSVTMLKGIKDKIANGEVMFSEGCDLAEGIHNLRPVPAEYFMTEKGEKGVMGEYFSNAGLTGKPLFTRTDADINFYWESGSPSEGLPDDDFSVRWTGYLVPPVSGTYYLGSWGMPTLEIWFEGELLIKFNSEHHAFHHEKPVKMEAGKKYKFVFEYKNWHGDGDAKFLWAMPSPDMKTKALEIAARADVVVLGMGLSQRLEGEEMNIKVDGFQGGDRTHLNLPATQLELMKELKKLGKPMILVLQNGSALSVNWENENIDAIISAGYTGQEGGNAIADVIFGDYNPAGRLPVTWYKSVEQLPAFENYDMTGRTYRYFTGEPLYSFGYGLSYTSFGYSDLVLPEKIKAGEPVNISVKVKNTGNMAGDEVVQLYTRDEKASTPRPIVQLEGFQRIHLEKGESKTVGFTLKPEQLSIINKKDKRVIERGWFTLSVGGGQPGAKGSVSVSKRFKVKGNANMPL